VDATEPEVPHPFDSREDTMMRFLFTYADDVAYWLGFASLLVFMWFAFVGIVHSLTEGR
jgi:hypothetical protein